MVHSPRGRLDWLMLALAAAEVVVAALLVTRPAFVLAAWPFAGTTELTFDLVASIFAAAAASEAWVALIGETAAYVGIALDYLGISAPLAIYLLVVDPVAGGGQRTVGLIALAGTTFGAWLLWRTTGAGSADRPPSPRLVVASFGLFAAVLTLVGLMLLADVPDVLPWAVTPELSVVVGLSFLGAALYFGYGVLRPTWTNAGGQLAGFLAYDLALVLPLAGRLGSITAQFRLSLIAYLAVVLSSGVLAGWYLFVDPPTRIRVRH